MPGTMVMSSKNQRQQQSLGINYSNLNLINKKGETFVYYADTP